jgi:hypothetical protein
MTEENSERKRASIIRSKEESARDDLAARPLDPDVAKGPVAPIARTHKAAKSIQSWLTKEQIQERAAKKERLKAAHSARFEAALKKSGPNWLLDWAERKGPWGPLHPLEEYQEGPP